MNNFVVIKQNYEEKKPIDKLVEMELNKISKPDTSTVLQKTAKKSNS